MIDALEVFSLAFLVGSVAFWYVARLDQRDEASRLPLAQNARKLLRSGALRRYPK